MEVIREAVKVEVAATEDRAEKVARATIEEVYRELDVAGGDRRVVAPYPKGNLSKAAYRAAEAKYRLVRALTTSDAPCSFHNAPDLGSPNLAAAEAFVAAARADAAAQHEAFVTKLASKVGEVTAAELVGSHVWGHSVLTVTKADGSTERWKTQMIVNVSVLGKLFNQFPTRKVK